jgi:hypothetical protein
MEEFKASLNNIDTLPVEYAQAAIVLVNFLSNPDIQGKSPQDCEFKWNMKVRKLCILNADISDPDKCQKAFLAYALLQQVRIDYLADFVYLRGQK